MDATLNMIATVGFPIVMCLLLFYQMQADQKANRETLDTVREAIAQNTQAINALKESLHDHS